MTEQPAPDSDAKLALDLHAKTLREVKSLNAKMAWLLFFATMSFLGGILTFLNDFMRAF